MLFGNLTRRPVRTHPERDQRSEKAVSSDNALATADSGDSLLAAIGVKLLLFH